MIKIDRHTVIQVLGSLMNKPDYLSDTDKYRIEVTDFPYTLDKFIFAAINNLYNEGNGANKIRSIDITNYYKNNVAASAVIEKENGEMFLQDCEANGDPQNFNYYYQKLKKLNLLIDIQNSSGRDVSNIYCEDVLNPKCSEINEKFEKMTVSDIINILKLEVSNYEKDYAFNTEISEGLASDDIDELVIKLKDSPEIGCPLQGDIINSICRGGRKGRLYLRSAQSGYGKSRNMVGDACNLAYPIRFDRKIGKWVETGNCEKVLYIMTEQDPDEIKTMILAYLTGYNEEIFLYGLYGKKEMPRIQQAIKIMKEYQDNLLFARIPDPCSSVIKNIFRRYNIQFGVENFFYDYIFSSPAMLNEFRDLRIREDVALRMFTTTLKNLALELNAFIMTSTQISSNGENKDEGGFKDYHNIQGSRSIVNLVDFACIMSRPTNEELAYFPTAESQFGYHPNLVTDIFKNRGGRWTMIRVWSYVDLGTCRKIDLFVTDTKMQPITEFQLIDFSKVTESKYQEVCDEYNKGFNNSNIVTEILPQISDIKPEELVDTKVFDDKRRFKNTDFSDLI